VQIKDLSLAGLRLVSPEVFGDSRGFFIETYQQERYAKAGITEAFVQDNYSRSKRNTLRGLHYQSGEGQAKLIQVLSGRIYDVAVDIRPGSPTFGNWCGEYLDAEAHAQMYVPVGFAHGFCVLSEYADVMYKVSRPYDARIECGIRWNDAEIGVSWPVDAPILSVRDEQTESFADYKKRVLKA
jgi:dTDP-4-dehydrorhamnose 3,5-epimerase